MNNKKLIFGAIALVLVVAALLGIYFLTRPEAQDGAKTITVTVVHKDKTEVVKTYHTDELYLDKALLAEGLIGGNEDQYGFVVITVDGERAQWDTDNAYWCLQVNGQAATTGISAIPVEDGQNYQLVYTPLA